MLSSYKQAVVDATVTAFKTTVDRWPEEVIPLFAKAVELAPTAAARKKAQKAHEKALAFSDKCNTEDSNPERRPR